MVSVALNAQRPGLQVDLQHGEASRARRQLLREVGGRLLEYSSVQKVAWKRHVVLKRHFEFKKKKHQKLCAQGSSTV